MIKKIKNIFYLTLFVIFTFFTANFYFSDENIIKTNKSRSFYSVSLSNDLENLPLLLNDTNFVIEYRDDINTYKEKEKNHIFWDLIKNY